jgi:catechol 2,3-dioxygenase-like lactoylglutathione lyase family enzyme
MSTHSTDTAANHATREEANRNLMSIRPSFIVKDLQTSIAYYRERLGFQLDFQGPDEGPFWAGVSRDGIGIMLKAVASDVPPMPHHTRHEWAPPDALIYSTDPDALFDEFTQHGASFVKTLSFVEEGLWGFSISDADGYVLVFYQLLVEKSGTAPHR